MEKGHPLTFIVHGTFDDHADGRVDSGTRSKYPVHFLEVWARRSMAATPSVAVDYRLVLVFQSFYLTVYTLVGSVESEFGKLLGDFPIYFGVPCVWIVQGTLNIRFSSESIHSNPLYLPLETCSTSHGLNCIFM